MKELINKIKLHPAHIAIVNFSILMLLYMLQRLFFFWQNINLFPEVDSSLLSRLCIGGLRFDLSALCYINSLYFILQLIPFDFRYKANYQKVMKYIFVILNIIGILANLFDVIYFDFGGRRSTFSIFSEFAGEDNQLKILWTSIFQYPIVWIFGLINIAILIIFYYNPIKKQKRENLIINKFIHYTFNSLIFLFIGFWVFIGLRGGWELKMHPLRMDSADIYTKKPSQAGIVLNTPFTMLTTIHRADYNYINFFPEEKLDSIFNPIHTPNIDSLETKKYNIVILILESFSREYYGYYNKDLDNGNYLGYTPFLDSLLEHSYRFRYSFANSVRSVDAMPSSICSVPRYINPYVYYKYANNTVEGLPNLLKEIGYYSAFYHGAPNTTLGFNAFANAAGYNDYFGLTEYKETENYKDEDFDGTWALFDEAFLQYFAKENKRIAQNNQPFLATVFTASSHQPFAIPSKYQGKFRQGPHPMLQAINYADYSLKQYFLSIKNEDWFNNTIFVFTADHTGLPIKNEYANENGKFLVPIFFYTPGGQLPEIEITDRIMQQIDIVPSLLSLINYQKPYFSFGKDIFSKDTSNFINFAFNDLNGSSHYYLDSLMLQFNKDSVIGLFDYTKDMSLKNNILDQKDNYPQFEFMQEQTKAIIQQYILRMKQNRLTYQNNKK